MPVRLGGLPYDPSKATTSIAGLLTLSPTAPLSAAQKVTLSTGALNLLQSVSDQMSVAPSRAVLGELLHRRLAAHGALVTTPTVGTLVLPGSVAGMLPLGATRTQGFAVELRSDLLVASLGAVNARVLPSSLVVVTQGTVGLTSDLVVASPMSPVVLTSDLLVTATGAVKLKRNLPASLVVQGAGTATLSSDLSVALLGIGNLASDVLVQIQGLISAITSDVLVQGVVQTNLTSDIAVGTSATLNLTADVSVQAEVSLALPSDLVVQVLNGVDLTSAVAIMGAGTSPLGSDLLVGYGLPDLMTLALASDLVTAEKKSQVLDSDVLVIDPEPPPGVIFPELISDLAVIRTSGGVSDLYSDVVVALSPRKFLFSSIAVLGTTATQFTNLGSDMVVV